MHIVNVIDEGIKNKELYLQTKPFSCDEAESAMKFVLQRVDENMSSFTNGFFPASASQDLRYQPVENVEWTNGFYPGMLWLCYEYTQKEKYKLAAEHCCESFINRIEKKIEVDHHDMGFLYSLSCVAGYKITGNRELKRAALLAADQLLTRYKANGAFIQAWGDMDDPRANRLIIDCMNNIPLLFWATQVCGDEKYAEVGVHHANSSLKTVIREDASTHHTFYFDFETGAPLKGVTSQGYSDQSAWARGQAWGVSGFPIVYRYTKNSAFNEAGYKVANFFLNRLPSDFVPYWDLVFGDGSGEERDSSAAAIAVTGLYELINQPDSGYHAYYRGAIGGIMRSLTNNYLTKDCDSNGILLHGVYTKPGKRGIDECMIWGDYYYTEALFRTINPDWNIYW